MSGAAAFRRFAGGAGLAQSLAEFSGIPSTPLPASINAELRPYQRAASISCAI
jgi:hypothetical protein